MANLQEFIDYLNSFVDRAIYVWGGQRQVIKKGIAYKNDAFVSSLGKAEDWIKKAETGTTNANRAIKLYNSRKDRYNEIPCVDCSGLGMNYIQNKAGLSKTDLNANGMKGKCTALKASQLRKGDWVFRTYKSGSNKGRAYHIGYIVDDSLNVVEAYGRDKGVIKRAFNSSYWNAYGRPSYFKAEIEKNDKPAEMVFTRLLKKTSPMISGEDVKNLQAMLNDAIDGNLAVDGKLGSKTAAAIKTYQKSRGLAVDGKAGKNTITALGGVWQR